MIPHSVFIATTTKRKERRIRPFGRELAHRDVNTNYFTTVQSAFRIPCGGGFRINRKQKEK